VVIDTYVETSIENDSHDGISDQILKEYPFARFPVYEELPHVNGNPSTIRSVLNKSTLSKIADSECVGVDLQWKVGDSAWTKLVGTTSLFWTDADETIISDPISNLVNLKWFVITDFVFSLNALEGDLTRATLKRCIAGFDRTVQGYLMGLLKAMLSSVTSITVGRDEWTPVNLSGGGSVYTRADLNKAAKHAIAYGESPQNLPPELAAPFEAIRKRYSSMQFAHERPLTFKEWLKRLVVRGKDTYMYGPFNLFEDSNTSVSDVQLFRDRTL